MIIFKKGSDNLVDFSIDDMLKCKITERYSRASDILKKISESTPGLLPTEDIILLSRHPLSQALIAFSEGRIENNRGEKILSSLCKLDKNSISALEKKRPVLLQDKCLFPQEETRGQKINIIEDSPLTDKIIETYYQNISEYCGEKWSDYIEIIKCISCVEIPNMGKLPYFSGADSICWGAMHMTNPADMFIFSETLTHEAGHVWMYLLEETGELADNTWTYSDCISPWRNDKRPIGGIIHGVFVFACVASVLQILLTKQLLQKKVTTNNEVVVETRISRLVSQVIHGCYELEKYVGIKENGKSVINLSMQLVEQIKSELNKDIFIESMEKVENEMNLKRQ